MPAALTTCLLSLTPATPRPTTAAAGWKLPGSSGVRAPTPTGSAAAGGPACGGGDMRLGCALTEHCRHPALPSQAPRPLLPSPRLQSLGVREITARGVAEQHILPLMEADRALQLPPTTLVALLAHVLSSGVLPPMAAAAAGGGASTAAARAPSAGSGGGGSGSDAQLWERLRACLVVVTRGGGAQRLSALDRPLHLPPSLGNRVRNSVQLAELPGARASAQTRCEHLFYPQTPTLLPPPPLPQLDLSALFPGHPWLLVGDEYARHGSGVPGATWAAFFRSLGATDFLEIRQAPLSCPAALRLGSVDGCMRLRCVPPPQPGALPHRGAALLHSVPAARRAA